MKLRHPRIAALAAVTVCGLLVGSGNVAQAADAAPTEPTVRTELEQAKSSGAPVEIVSDRTATGTTYVNPSGTYTREIASEPVRVRDGRGVWVDIDHTLRAADGVVKPVAARDDIELSAGGDGPFISITTSGVETSFSWPTTLPEPALDGPTATYESVLDGVDLKVRVSEAGVSHVLVVHDAVAARNPQLAELRLATQVSSGSLVQKAGGFAIRDRSGREVAQAAEPTMWDSSGTARDADRVSGPADGDHVAPVRAEVGDGELVLTPDADALTGTDVTYPLFIDPTVVGDFPSKWAMVDKKRPTTSSYRWADSEVVGHHPSGSTKRLLWSFGIPNVAGSKVLSATLQAQMARSVSCAERAVRVYRVGHVSSTSTWNRQPSWGVLQDSRTAAAGYAGCHPRGIVLAWDVMQGASAAAREKQTRVAFGMRVVDETDRLTGRRFYNTASLRVEYNRYPGVPTALQIDGKPCGPDVVPVIRRTEMMPRMSAVVTDPDGDQIRGQFQAGTPGSTFTPRPGSPFTSAPLGSGRRVQWPAPLEYNDEGSVASGTYAFRVRGLDSGNLTSRYSAVCTFKVDASPPS